MAVSFAITTKQNINRTMFDFVKNKKTEQTKKTPHAPSLHPFTPPPDTKRFTIKLVFKSQAEKLTFPL